MISIIVCLVLYWAVCAVTIPLSCYKSGRVYGADVVLGFLFGWVIVPFIIVREFYLQLTDR